MKFAELLDHIDAHVFTGDTIHSAEERQQLLYYVGRWQREATRLEEESQKEQMTKITEDIHAVLVQVMDHGRLELGTPQSKRLLALNAELKQMLGIKDEKTKAKKG